MPNLGFGKRNEQQQASRALQGVGIHSLEDATRFLKKHRRLTPSPDVLHDINTMFGRVPEISKGIAVCGGKES